MMNLEMKIKGILASIGLLVVVFLLIVKAWEDGILLNLQDIFVLNVCQYLHFLI